MLDFQPLAANPISERVEFFGNTVAVGVTWQIWNKPKGKTVAYIMAFGSGGGGGTGVVGLNSASAGGGGGGSSGQTSLILPLTMLPDILYISAPIGGTGAGIATYVSIHPSTTANHVVCIANGGGVGGNAAAGTGGAAGAAGAIATNATMPLGWGYSNLALAGQAGIIGGAAIAGAALTLPLTGLLTTGGTGGGGLPAAAAVGTAGGSFTVPAAPSPYPPQPGGTGGTAGTTPPTLGSNGWMVMNNLFYSYGGTGGGSTHGTATGAGAVQAKGGDGANMGAGGGGMGGALTGSVAAVQSKGGSGYVSIICW